MTFPWTEELQLRTTNNGRSYNTKRLFEAFKTLNSELQHLDFLPEQRLAVAYTLNKVWTGTH